jgi:NAD+ diphosphatase
MVGFVARVAPGTDITGQPDGEEIVALRWFTRAELAAAVDAGDVILPGPTSIARAIIEHWYGGEIPDGARTWG